MPILSRGGGATSSSNIGDLNAPAWKAGGPTSGSGAWGSVGVGTEESLVLGYSDTTGTAGFVSLQCTGDTDSFQLTEVEGEDIGTPQTFSALTNDHDLMYIAFKGTLAAGDRNITIKILPIYMGNVAKTMTITALDHEGNTVGSVTASATILITTLSITSHSDFNSSDSSQTVAGVDDLQFGSVVNPGGAPAGTYTGLYRSGGATGWTNWIRIDKEIASGADGYLEFTQTPSTVWAAHWILGITYKTDYDTAFPAQSPAVGATHHRWGHYNWGGGNLVGHDWINDPSPSVFDFTGSWATPPQSLRIEWSSNTVTLVGSSDGWNTKSVLHTYADQIDVATNGNLVAYFSIYHNNSTGVVENIKLRGNLV